VPGFPAPDCGCQKTAGSSTRRLRTIVQQDTAWKLPGGTAEKVDFTCAPRIANDSRFISELLVRQVKEAASTVFKSVVTQEALQTWQ
jgi:hypothetical protein